MTDNLLLNSGSGGDTVAADEISGVKHQRVKISQGADGVAVDTSSAAPLNVTMANAVLTAAVHAITATINSSAMSDGLTAITPKFATVAADTENKTAVAAVVGKKIRVLQLLVVGVFFDGAKIRFEDGAGGTNLTGYMPIGDNSDVLSSTNGAIISLPFSPVGWFETSVNTLLNVASSGIGHKVNLTYVEVA